MPFDDGTPDNLTFRLGTREGWTTWRVVRWHGVEELCRPFRFEITVLRDGPLGPADLDELLDSPASFLIPCEAGRRLVHGIVDSITELDRSATIFAYEIVLVPHFQRALHRTDCRTFRRRGIVDIVSTVLANAASGGPEAGGLSAWDGSFAPLGDPAPGPSFVEPRAEFRWALAGAEAEPLHDPAYRSHVTQFNESGFHFVSRLLEDTV